MPPHSTQQQQQHHMLNFEAAAWASAVLFGAGSALLLGVAAFVIRRLDCSLPSTWQSKWGARCQHLSLATFACAMLNLISSWTSYSLAVQLDARSTRVLEIRAGNSDNDSGGAASLERWALVHAAVAALCLLAALSFVWRPGSAPEAAMEGASYSSAPVYHLDSSTKTTT